MTRHFYIMILVLLMNCTSKVDSNISSKSKERQLYNAYKDMFFRAVKNNNEVVFDYIIFNDDTATLQDDWNAMDRIPATGEKHDWVSFKKGDRIVAKEEIGKVIKFDAYDSSLNFKAAAFLPTFQFKRLYHPHSDFQKVLYYSKQTELLKKYKLEICEKYGITEDSLDVFVSYYEHLNKDGQN